MTEMTTVKMPTKTRDRLRARAKAEHMTQYALIDAMLAEREEAAFWEALAASGQPTQAELDEVDAAFLATALDGDTDR